MSWSTDCWAFEFVQEEFAGSMVMVWFPVCPCMYGYGSSIFWIIQTLVSRVCIFCCGLRKEMILHIITKQRGSKWCKPSKKPSSKYTLKVVSSCIFPWVCRCWKTRFPVLGPGIAERRCCYVPSDRDQPTLPWKRRIWRVTFSIETCPPRPWGKECHLQKVRV